MPPPVLMCSGPWIFRICSGVVPGGFAAEMRRAMDNIDAVLRAAGCGFADIIRVTVSLTGIGRCAEMDAIMREDVTEPFPARNTIGVAALWGGARVGLDVWAIRPAGAACQPLAPHA
ncbi:RidA family protein [Elioraea sp.]|uniref:RidA family protein n=1 Tax=Elioraea sp. TaxID=2185103 RepID=UPI0025C08E3C|nr:Rid family hydrolase [Elioraea sp.]